VSRRPEPLWWFGRPGEPARPAAPDRPRSSWRAQGLDAIACLSLSTICFSQARHETLSYADWGFYHRTPLGLALSALVLNIVTLAAVASLCVQGLRRVPFAGSLVRLRSVLRVIRGIAVVASPLVLITLGQALWMLLETSAGPEWRLVEAAPLARTAPSLRRVVWLVFGELDQRLTFEARPAGLELPELDRLRRESLYADAAHPPAGTADVVMPALITGRPVVAVAPISPNELELTFADGKAARWSAQPNVFSRARTLGYDTALIGWDLPYPRVLGASLGRAEWRPSVAHEQARGDTLGQALWNQWGTLAPPVHARRLFSRRFAELGELAIRAATEGRFGLVLLHLPAPHLILADRVVGELRRAIDRSHLGDRTWLVVSSDGWGRASRRDDGPAEPRVPFLVRPPDGGRGTHVDAPFNTLATHDLILAILRGSLSDTRDAAAWLGRHPVAPPRGYTAQGRPVY
jgi:hypothetical protein